MLGMANRCDKTDGTSMLYVAQCCKNSDAAPAFLSFTAEACQAECVQRNRMPAKVAMSEVSATCTPLPLLPLQLPPNMLKENT
jgi:hypothetical protein